MADKRPVIVYGANGYTGRLVCEYLREYNVPFIAAGRDKAKVRLEALAAASCFHLTTMTTMTTRPEASR